MYIHTYAMSMSVLLRLYDCMCSSAYTAYTVNSVIWGIDFGMFAVTGGENRQRNRTFLLKYVLLDLKSKILLHVVLVVEKPFLLAI